MRCRLQLLGNHWYVFRCVQTRNTCAPSTCRVYRLLRFEHYLLSVALAVMAAAGLLYFVAFPIQKNRPSVTSSVLHCNIALELFYFVFFSFHFGGAFCILFLAVACSRSRLQFINNIDSRLQLPISIFNNSTNANNNKNTNSFYFKIKYYEST